jgi:hypothetical protein
MGHIIFIYLFTDLFIYLFVCLFVHLFTCLLVYLIKSVQESLGLLDSEDEDNTFF